jgi:hypothetical protein
MSNALRLLDEQDRIEAIQSEAVESFEDYTKLDQVALPIGKHGLHPFAREPLPGAPADHRYSTRVIPSVYSTPLKPTEPVSFCIYLI